MRKNLDPQKTELTVSSMCNGVPPSEKSNTHPRKLKFTVSAKVFFLILIISILIIALSILYVILDY